MNATVAILESMLVHASRWVLKQSCITDYMKQEHVFLANIDVQIFCLFSVVSDFDYLI